MPQIGLQRLDLSGNGTLRNMQSTRRCCQRALTRGRTKQSQVV
jgi:hypothetical protein